MKRHLISVLLLPLSLAVVSACGGEADEPTVEGSTGTESPGSTGDHSASSDACNGHRVDDTYIDEEAFAACLEMEAQCPGAVLELESCPLQFACE